MNTKFIYQILFYLRNFIDIALTFFDSSFDSFLFEVAYLVFKFPYFYEISNITFAC